MAVHQRSTVMLHPTHPDTLAASMNMLNAMKRPAIIE
jgi:hypothetical protein